MTDVILEVHGGFSTVLSGVTSPLPKTIPYRYFSRSDELLFDRTDIAVDGKPVFRLRHVDKQDRP